MTLSYHPMVGAILLCDYETGFREPEMIKTRPVVVVTPRLRRRDGLCTVVPLSTSAPEPPMPYHHKLTLARTLPKPFDSPVMWVKADMFSTVCYDRLSQLGIGRGHDGKRKYLNLLIPLEDLQAIQRCILHALNLPHLTEHL